jgi:hypothetical protein
MEPAMATGALAAWSRASLATSTARLLIAATSSPRPAGSSICRPAAKVLVMITCAPARM